MSKEQVRMMNDDDKLIKEANNPLTDLFRRVLKEMGVEAQAWNQRLTRFLKSPLSRVPKNAKDIGQERNNFNRAIAKRHITFKTFHKAIQILGPVKYSMSITMVMRDGSEIKVSTGMMENSYSKIDSLVAAVTGEGLNPDSDIDEYDSEDEDNITDDDVDEKIHQISNPTYDSTDKVERKLNFMNRLKSRGDNK